MGARALAARAAVAAGMVAMACSGMSGAASPAAAQTAPSVTVGALSAQVFANPTDSGSFTATPAQTPLWTQTFPVLDFNPPAGSISCTPATAVDDGTRPFTDVVPQAGGACSTIVVQGNGLQAGVANTGGPDLTSFQMMFSTSFTVSAAGNVTFNFFSDDGWVLGIGKGPGGAQPTYVSGSLENPPAATPFKNYPVVGSFNNTTSPAQNDVVVNFPAAGTYPVELDYTECCGGQLSFTLNANGSTIQPGATVTASKTADRSATIPSATDGYSVTLANGSSSSFTVSTVTDTLPTGFTFVPGSTTGGITTAPAVSGNQLLWTGSFTVPPGGALMFHFNVTVATAPGHYTNTVTADAGSASVVPATNVAPIDVATVVATPAFPVEGLPLVGGTVGTFALAFWVRRRRRAPR